MRMFLHSGKVWERGDFARAYASLRQDDRNEWSNLTGKQSADNRASEVAEVIRMGAGRLDAILCAVTDEVERGCLSTTAEADAMALCLPHGQAPGVAHDVDGWPSVDSGCGICVGFAAAIGVFGGTWDAR